MREVRYHASALRDLCRYGNVASRIERAMQDYAANPAAHANNVIRLTRAETYRMRVGAFRVLFEDNGETLLVTKVGPRGSVYD